MIDKDIMQEQTEIGAHIPIRTQQVVNTASVSHRSPFRYPGGKTWLVPTIRAWLDGLDYRPSHLIDPFTGGGIVPLSALFDDRVDEIVLVELDQEVAAVWQTIIDDPTWLVAQIEAFEINLDTVRAVLASEPTTTEERAFRTIIKNRTQRGGILAKGASLMKTGEKGKGVASRWYPQTLAKRIRAIHTYKDRITVYAEDGLPIIAKYISLPTAAFFVDPPYTAGGKRAGSRLYNHNELDHEALFDLMAAVQGQFMMTYDNAQTVIDLSEERNFTLEKIPMKNAHHRQMYELLITNQAI